MCHFQHIQTIIYRLLSDLVHFLLRARFAVDCHHFADRNATQRVVVQEAEAMCLQRDLFGRGEGRPHHDRAMGRKRRGGISLRHQRLVGRYRLFATQDRSINLVPATIFQRILHSLILFSFY